MSKQAVCELPGLIINGLGPLYLNGPLFFLRERRRENRAIFFSPLGCALFFFGGQELVQELMLNLFPHGSPFSSIFGSSSV